jgi:8-oxo-dGTP pyrophosphatase MutT (NUDIX family)
MNNPWKILSTQKIYENPWIELNEYQVINPQGGNGIYGVVHFKHIAIGVIPLDEELNTWIVGQYRFPLNEYSWEIPEGGGKLEVPILESAKRELLEECGIIAQKWNCILKMHLSNSVSDEVGYVWVAQDLSFTKSQPEETELLEVQKIPFSELYERVMNGEITDSLSVAGVLKLQCLLKEGKF